MIIFLFCKGTYAYSGTEYAVYPPISGYSYDACREIVLKAIEVNEPCPHSNCTFGGIWDGGRGNGQRTIYATSSFFYLTHSVIYFYIIYILVFLSDQY